MEKSIKSVRVWIFSNKKVKIKLRRGYWDKLSFPEYINFQFRLNNTDAGLSAKLKVSRSTHSAKHYRLFLPS